MIASDKGEEKMRSYCLMSTEFQFYKMKRDMEMDGVMVVQHDECI